MSNSIAPGSSADVSVRVTALTTNPNVPVTYKTIILKKNLVNGVNTLTQEMMSATNIKYIVKYDYVLGENITVPANCVLEFEGGSISASGNNDTITGQNSSLNAEVYTIFKNVKLDGTWNCTFDLAWFGVNSNDSNALSNFRNIVNVFDPYFRKSFVLNEDITLSGGNIYLPKYFVLNGKGHTITFENHNDDGCLLLSYADELSDISFSVSSSYEGTVILMNTSKREAGDCTGWCNLRNIKISGGDGECLYTGISFIATNNHSIKTDNYITGCFISNISIIRSKIAINILNENIDDPDNNYAWSNSIYFNMAYLEAYVNAIRIERIDIGGTHSSLSSVSPYHFANVEIQAKNSSMTPIYIKNVDVISNNIYIYDSTSNGTLDNSTLYYTSINPTKTSNSTNGTMLGFTCLNGGKLSVRFASGLSILGDNWDYGSGTNNCIFKFDSNKGFRLYKQLGNILGLYTRNNYGVMFLKSPLSSESAHDSAALVYKNNALDIVSFAGDSGKGEVVQRYRPEIALTYSQVKTGIRNTREVQVNINTANISGSGARRVKATFGFGNYYDTVGYYGEATTYSCNNPGITNLCVVSESYQFSIYFDMSANVTGYIKVFFTFDLNNLVTFTRDDENNISPSTLRDEMPSTDFLSYSLL